MSAQVQSAAVLVFGSAHKSYMWSAGTRLTISVDLSTFNYTAAIQGGTPWLVEGAVALQCGGERYATNSGKALV